MSGRVYITPFRSVTHCTRINTKKTCYESSYFTLCIASTYTQDVNPLSPMYICTAPHSVFMSSMENRTQSVYILRRCYLCTATF